MSKRAMPGSSSFTSGSGATKSGMTNWSSERRVSRTSPRSEAVRRKRRSRVTGNELTPGWYAGRGQAVGAGGGSEIGGFFGSTRISPSGASSDQVWNSTRSAKNSHAARPAASSGSATRIPANP